MQKMMTTARLWGLCGVFGVVAAAVGCGGEYIGTEPESSGGADGESRGGAPVGGGGTTAATGGTTAATGSTEGPGGVGAALATTGGTNFGGTPTIGTGGTTTPGGGGYAGYPNTGGGAGCVGCSGLLTPEVLASGWIGGDPATMAEDPAGIQGMIYAFGDNVACMAVEGNPCTASGCCINYTTVVDTSYQAWGCGIGIVLNETGGNPSTKYPYSGPAIGFAVTTTNTGTAPVRIGYTQSADVTGKVPPFVYSVGGSESVLFTDVSCPAWASSDMCTPPGPPPFDLQIQIVGGDQVSSGTLCLTYLTTL